MGNMDSSEPSPLKFYKKKLCRQLNGKYIIIQIFQFCKKQNNLKSTKFPIFSVYRFTNTSLPNCSNSNPEPPSSFQNFSSPSGLIPSVSSTPGEFPDSGLVQIHFNHIKDHDDFVNQ